MDMTHSYKISGMTCNGCVAKAKSELLKLGDITEAEVQLAEPQARIIMSRHIPVEELQNALSKAGKYTISETSTGYTSSKSAHNTSSASAHNASDALAHNISGESAYNVNGQASWLSTYKPVLLIGVYIAGISLLVETVNGHFDTDRWMSHFMAAFFLTFSFFKLLNLKGFAESYSSYDIIARRWQSWGYIYAFLELLLGVSYLVRFMPLVTNIVTFFVMGVSIIGVLQSVLSKKKIQCACLGAVFNLPMSTITIIEDALMILMSALMIINL
jgi:cation transport ATPase